MISINFIIYICLTSRHCIISIQYSRQFHMIRINPCIQHGNYNIAIPFGYIPCITTIYCLQIP